MIKLVVAAVTRDASYVPAKEVTTVHRILELALPL
jgi:hypothetical protein